jgi:E3 ubiquitin-protein ligase HUWE1
LFHHHQHTDEFITAVNGLERLGRITALPCLPFDWANSVSSDSLVQVVRTLAEAATSETLSFLSTLVKQSLDETADFWNSFGGPSKLAGMLQISHQDLASQNQRFRRIVTLQTRVTLLSEVYATAGYVHGRTALAILQALMGSDAPEIIPDLGSLHRACVWENIVLKKALLDQGVATGASGIIPSTAADPAMTAAAAVAQAAEAAGVDDEVIASLSGSPEGAKGEEKNTPRSKNAQALRHVVTQMPAALAPLFQGFRALSSFHFSVSQSKLQLS